MNAITINYDNLFQRLLMLNQMGAYLDGQDGHIWINGDIGLDTIMVNSKIYGGVIEALDTIDEALRRDGQEDLLTMWNNYGKDVLFLGSGGVDESRIDKVKSGQGGIF